MKKYKGIITTVIKQMGIPASLIGYHYIRDAVEMMIEDINLIKAITKTIYPAVATKYGTSASRVERGIRHAIEVGYDRANAELKNKMFSYSLSADAVRPTNSEFLAAVADYVILKCEHEGDGEADA